MWQTLGRTHHKLEEVTWASPWWQRAAWASSHTHLGWPESDPPYQTTQQRGLGIPHLYPAKKCMKSLNSKTDISIFINLRYLRLKLLKNKENNKKICHIFHHNFKNIPCYVMSEVSLKRFYFALFDDGLTLKTLKLAFIGFWIQTLHI